MSAVTVENLAKIIGSEGKTLLSQMKEAGLSHTDVKDEVTDKDKKTLLEFLKEQQNKSSKTISLNKSAKGLNLPHQEQFQLLEKLLQERVLKNQLLKLKELPQQLISMK